MSRNLLPPETGAGVTGPWTNTSMGGRRAYPARLSAVSSAKTGWTAGDVVIEELIGGIPGQSNSPYGPSADSGVVQEIGRLGFPGGDLIIDKPVEFIRARTESNATFTGKCFVGIEMLE